MTEQANASQNPETSEKSPSQSEQPKEKSEIELLREKLEKQEAELKRIKEEKLDSKTSPTYFEQMRAQKRQQREAKILSVNPPPQTQKLSREQLESMSPADLVDYFEGRLQQQYRAITTEKIYPLVEQTKEDNAQAQLKQLDKLYPKWEKWIPIMTPISKADPDAGAVEILKMAMAKQGDMEALAELNEIIAELDGKPKKGKKVSEMEKKEEKVEEQLPIVSGGEKPSVSVGSVKSPGKPLSSRDAARKAYEQVFENRGG